MIPKKLHYCWYGPKQIPRLLLKCIKTWDEILPGYELILWNEENSPMDHNFIQQAYKAGKYAFVSDYVRFWALFNHGGIYLDADIFILKSFDELLNNEVFFAWETSDNHSISCGVVGSVQGHPFLRDLVSYYDSISFTTKALPELVVPGIVKKCYDNYSNRNIIRIYPYDYFYPFPYDQKENISRFLDYKTNNTLAIHLWSTSWGTFYAKFKDYILYHLRKIL